MLKSTINVKKFYIKKRSVPEWLLFFLIFAPFVFGLIIDFMKLPTVIRFSLDFALVCAVGITFARKEFRIKRAFIPVIVYFLAFTFYLIASYLISFQSVFYFIWGFRNNFRFIFAIFVFITFLEFEDAKQYLKVFDILYWVNFVICLVEFYLFGYKQDYLGGIFGVSVGCNVYLNVFLCICTAKALIEYLNTREKIKFLLLKLFAAFYIGALSELKFFFIEFLIMLCIVSLITKFTWKKVGIIAVGIVGVFIGVTVLIRIFPEYVGQFTLELLYESAASDKGYTSSGDINRLSAVRTITQSMFTEGYHIFIGYGLGNCDLSAISLFNTPFYESNKSMNYNWFSHAFMYLETGYIGLFLFIGLFIMFFILAKKSAKSGYADLNSCQLSMTISLMCLLFMIYNTSLRIDSVYMIAFVLALPFIKKEKREESPLIN